MDVTKISRVDPRRAARSNSAIRCLTILNERGDTTLAWTEDRDESMAEIIAKKMSEGVAFFIIEPRGEPIEIPGPTLTLRLSSAGSIEHDGHGALRTEIVSHTGEPLGGLCVYLENTPALDQLAALSLYMSDAESEAELLSKSNLIALTEAGRSHPALAARHRDSGAFDVIDQVSDVFRRVRVRNDAYWADTGRIWTDTITIHAVGARVAPRLSAFVDTFRTLRHDADREATQEVAA